MTGEVISTPYSKIWIKDGILYYKIFPNSEITSKHAREIIEESMKLSEGKNIPVFGDISEVKSISLEAREYISGEEATKIASSLAILASSPISKIIGNFLISLNKPSYPVKLFTSKEKALEWLKTYSRDTNEK